MPAATPSSEHRRHTLGFKVTSAERVRLGFFFDTFYGSSVSAGLRWLILEHPEIAKVIDERIQSMTVQS